MDSIKIFLILFISSINSVKGQYLKFYSNNLELDYRNYNVYIIHSDSTCQKLNVLNEQSYLLPDAEREGFETKVQYTSTIT